MKVKKENLNMNNAISVTKNNLHIEENYVISVTENNINIQDSYNIAKKYFEGILSQIKNEHPECLVTQNRKMGSMKREWATHNLIYDLHLFRSHTKDVDINWPQKWYISLIYNVIGFFALFLIS